MALNEFELSAPLNIWSPFLFDNRRELLLDIYFLETGHPKDVHEKFGGSEVDIFRESLIQDLKKKNGGEGVWRVTGDGFAMIHSSKNIGPYSFLYRGLELKILKTSILLKSV